MTIADYGFAIWETFYVTVLSTAFSLVIGLPLGVLLVAGDKDGILPLPGWLMHLLNIIINILGAFVHSSRLQYIEFFGKFYEAGGRAFVPLALRTKYTDIVK